MGKSCKPLETPTNRYDTATIKATDLIAISNHTKETIVQAPLCNAYLDNAATMPILPAAADAMNEALREAWGNPSSEYEIGRIAKNALNQARAEIASCLDVDPDEIYFTSGSTESNNLAVRGACMARKKETRRIITSSLEHASVTRSVRGMRREGWEVVHIEDVAGDFDIAKLQDELEVPTTLVSVMHVQNELGWIMPIEEIVSARNELAPGTLVHCDATQSFGKIPVNPRELGVDLLTIAAHKIGGPRGIGALYVKRGTLMFTNAFGGGQEQGLRSGTEPVFLAAGFAVAAKQATQNLESNLAHVRELKSYLLAGLDEVAPDAIVNSRDDGSPYIVSISLPGIFNQDLVDFLSQRGIFVSKASACTNNHTTVPKGTWRKKHPLSLQAAGIPLSQGKSTVRISFAPSTTTSQVDMLLQGIKDFQ